MQRPSQTSVGIVEQLLIGFEELLLHSVQVGQHKAEQLTLLQSHYSKLPLKEVLVTNPIFKVLLLGEYRTHDINDSKMRANINLDESGILVLWQDETSFSFDQKVDVGHIISLKENVLVLWTWLRF